MDPQAKSNSPESAALQLWTIRDAMASDADQALRRVKAAGFSAVELAPLPPGLTPERLAECLARHDLTVVSIHGDLPTPANIDLWTRDRSRVPMLEDHLARLAARPAIRFPRRGARPDLGLQRGRDDRPGSRTLNSACTITGGSSSRSRESARSGCSTSRCTPTSSGNWTSTGRRRPAPIRRRARGIDAADRIAPLEGWAGRPRRADDGARAREGRCPADPSSPDASGRLGHRAR